MLKIFHRFDEVLFLENHVLLDLPNQTNQVIAIQIVDLCNVLQWLVENPVTQEIVKTIRKQIVNEAKMLLRWVHLLQDQIQLHLDLMMVAMYGINLPKTNEEEKTLVILQYVHL